MRIDNTIFVIKLVIPTTKNDASSVSMVSEPTWVQPVSYTTKIAVAQEQKFFMAFTP